MSVRKTNMLTITGDREALFALTTWPAVLNTHSKGTEVAGMQRYLLASTERSGNFNWLLLQISRGSPSSASSNTYLCTSLLAFSSGSTKNPGASAWPMTSLSNDIILSCAFLGYWEMVDPDLLPWNLPFPTLHALIISSLSSWLRNGRVLKQGSRKQALSSSLDVAGSL